MALLIREGRLCGNSVVSYLRKKGFPEVALQFVSDLKTRFSLAVEDGNLSEAAVVAAKIDEKVSTGQRQPQLSSQFVGWSSMDLHVIRPFDWLCRRRCVGPDLGKKQ